MQNFKEIKQLISANCSNINIVISALILIFYGSLAHAINYGFETLPQNSPERIYAESYIKELDTLNAKEDKYELFQKILDIKKYPDAVLATNWIQGKALNSGDPRYIYTYSYSLFKLGMNERVKNRFELLETSMSMMLLAKLMMQIDAARCEDSTAVSSKFFQWEGGAEKVMDYYNKLPNGNRLVIASFAFDLEDAHKARKPSQWLCSGGLSFFTEYFEKHGDDSNGKIVESPDVIGGKAIYLEDKEIKPKFISDEVWFKKREQIRDQFKKKYLINKP
jgi:hypothetical protein